MNDQVIEKGYSEPGRNDVHYSRPLTNISVAEVQENSRFIAAKVFPGISVSKQADAYYVYDRGDWNRDEATERTPGTESSGSGYSVSTSTYYAQVWATHKDINNQVRSNADDSFNLDKEATLFVTQKGLLRREILWATNFFTAGAPGDTWTFDVDGAATKSASFDPTSAANNDKVYWDDASSTPIEDVRQGKRYVLETTGYIPNALTLQRYVYDALIDHPDLVGRLDRGQTTGPAMANKAALAALFEVDHIHVMDAIKNTAKKGATNSHSFIGGKNALLSYQPSAPGLMTPSAGYTYNWTGLTGSADDMGLAVDKFYMRPIKSDRVELEMAFAQKVIGADLGYFFGGIVQ